MSEIRLVRIPLLASLWALAAAPLCAQKVAYEKFLLPNGMKVILHVDHSLPVVVINTWFDVGAKDEPTGRSGFAHLFEHLMFMGTERVPGNQFDALMEQGGGSNNASTNEDRTNYYSEGPAKLLPTLLWLDADRLEDLGRTMTTEKLDLQRNVVRNEIRQNVENTPYGRSHERIYRLMYPEKHPYHEAVYGTHQDLEAANADNVKDFFATFYVPNNASLCVVGDFDPAQIKPLITQLFGTLPRGGEITRRNPPQPKLDKVVRMTELDNIQLPLIKMCWHSPIAYAEGDAEIELLASVLTSGKSSRLYKRLVFDERLAVEVSASQDSLRLGSMFTLDVIAAPLADLDRIEHIVDEELAKVCASGITADELARQQTSYELGQLSQLQNSGSVADQLNAYEAAWGEPDSFARDLDRYRKATPAAVQQWARSVLDPMRRVILRVLPEQPKRSASPRDQRPADAAAAPFAPMQPVTFLLSNGVKVHLWSKNDLPLVSLQLQFMPGSIVTEPAHAGLAPLTAQMLQEGAGSRTALQFADAMQQLGSSFSVGADHETGTASLTVLRRNFDATADLLADAVQRPLLSAADFERVHALYLDGLRQQDDEPNVVAARVGMRVLFGKDNPYGSPASGTVLTAAGLTLADVQREHQALFTPDNLVVLIAGDLSVSDARGTLERAFGSWQKTGRAAVTTPDLSAQPAKGLRVVVVHRAEAVQTVVRFYAPAPTYARADRMSLQLLNTLLGGSFTSRLNQNLREKNGFTYGARSSYSLAPAAGFFSAGANVKSDVTGAAIKELMLELNRLGSGKGDITEDEVQKSQETLRTAIIQSYQGLRGIVSSASDIVLNGRPFTQVGSDLTALPKITADSLNLLSKAFVPLDQGILVLVGDRTIINDQIKDLALPTPVLLDAFGAAVATKQ
ncbi:MAG: pitrilysin family protein [Planctomycetota bacterium]|nr:pitrilysin family protein [Planctomycetota bacterium]